MVLVHNAACNRTTDRWVELPWATDAPDWIAIEDDLPCDHLARWMDRLVDALDLTALYATYRNRGSPAYRPDSMLKVVLYEMQLGRTKPAEWARDVVDSRPVQWLLRGLRPTRSRWYEFRDRLGPVLDQLNQQVVQAALDERLTTATRSAQDGTTIAAHASRHQLLKPKTLERRTIELRQAVEDDALGQTVAFVRPGRPVWFVPAWMARTPTGRAAQLERYERGRVEMSRRQEQNRQRASDKRKAPHEIQLSVSDPESALGRDKFKVFRPLYNVQMLHDLDSPLILAFELFAQPNDDGTLQPMLERHLEWTGRKPEKLLADSSYANALDLAVCDATGVELYAPYQENSFSAAKRAERAPQQIPKSAFPWLADEQTYECPQGHRLHRAGRERKRRSGGRTLEVVTYRCPAAYCQACTSQTECTSQPASGRTIKRSEHEQLVEALRARMETVEGKLLYSLRQQTVELGFADLKEHRQFRRFSGRGKSRARTEVGLLILAHNGLYLTKSRSNRLQVNAPADNSAALTPKGIAA